MDINVLVGGVADKDGVMRRLPVPRTVATLGRGCRLLAVHRPVVASDLVLWIVADGRRLCWMRPPGDEGDSMSLNEICMLGSEPGECARMGATVIVPTAGGLRYLRWTGAGYADLGDSLPAVDVEFRLVRESMTVVQTRIVIDLGDSITAAAVARGVSGEHPRVRLGASERHAAALGAMDDAVKAALLTAARGRVTARGRFWQPFLVRTALRLFDGSVTAHTPPVLMWPSAVPPLLEVSQASVDMEALTLSATTSFDGLRCCRLEMRLIGADVAQIEMWSDYLECLEVAVTEPVYTFDQQSPVRGIDSAASVCGVGVSGQRPVGGASDADSGGEEAVFLGHWADADGLSLERHASVGELRGRDVWIFKGRPESEFAEELVGKSVFRVFSSVDVESLKRLARSGDWTEVKCENGVGDLLSVLPVLPDGLRGRDRWDAQTLAVYNGRLMVAPRRRLLPVPCPLRSMAGRVDGTGEGSAVGVEVAYRIAGTAYRTRREPETVYSLDSSFPRWLFVADPEAVEVAFVSGTSVVRRVTLRRHAGLNGAYWYGGRGAQASVDKQTAATVAESGVVPCAGLVLTSQLRCPMVFGPGSSITVEGSRVMALRAALRPMSQGQFGDYPLYAFTDRGVCALQPDPSGSGAWESQRLVTPRGLVAPGVLTAMEDGVAYLSESGVMLLGGASVRCLDSTYERSRAGRVEPLTLPGIRRVAAWAGLEYALEEDALGAEAWIAPGCLAYDPRYRLLLHFRPGGSMYARVYGVEQGTWGLLGQTTTWHGVTVDGEGSSQPLLSDAATGRVMVLGDGPDDTPMLAVGEPVSRERPMRHGAVELSGGRPGGPESLTVYGSNDLVNWHPTASVTGSRLPPQATGTPFRHHIVVAVSRRSTATTI